MRKLSLAAVLSITALAGTATAADVQPIEGTLTNKHQIEVADNSTDPKAATVGEFMQDYPRGAPTRMRMFPTRQAMELTIHTEDGKRLKVVQDLDDVRDLEIGSKVEIDTVEGKQRVVAVK